MLSKPPKDMDLWRVMIGGMPAEWILPKTDTAGDEVTSTAGQTTAAVKQDMANAPPPSIATGSTLPTGLNLDDLTKRGVVLYFRGGGYVMGAIKPHRGIVAKFIRNSGVPTLLFEYRNSPEHPYPAALNDALAAYEYVLECGIPASSIIFAGDSAGGGLLLATLLYLKDHGRPLPAAAAALSPYTDLLCTGESLKSNADTCISPRGSWLVCARNYAGAQDASSPYISPLYGNLTGLPPLYVSAGGFEALLDDSVRFAKKAEESGVDVTLSVGEGMCHCYPACAPLFPEATAELANIGAFIRKHAGNG